MPEAFKFRHVHAITGTFILAVLAVAIAALVFAGRSQHWFIGNVALGVVLPQSGAGGIRQGSEVYFLGMLVGSVSDVRLDAAGRMEAQAKIRSDFFPFVRTDSSVAIKKKFGGVGDAYFEIARGKGAPLSPKNATIVCNEQTPSELEIAIEEIRHEAVPALKKLEVGLDTWTVLGSNLITSEERLDQLLVRLDSLAADLQQGKGTAGKLISDPELADEAQRLLARANQVMTEMQDVMTNLDVAVKNVRNATVQLPGITGAAANEARDLPGLVRQTQISMRELERLIEAMQRHWLLRKYVNKTNPPPLPAHPTKNDAANQQAPEQAPGRARSNAR